MLGSFCLGLWNLGFGNVSAVMIRIGFGGMLYDHSNKDHPNSIGTYLGFYIMLRWFLGSCILSC